MGKQPIKVPDLNRDNILLDDHKEIALSDYSVKSDDIEIYFRNIRNHLIEKIEEADAIIGCVAWLTDTEILKALAKKRSVSIIVQKEDFLRPDIKQISTTKLKGLYDKLNNLPPFPDGRGYTYFETPNLLQSISMCCDPSLAAIRCCGSYNRQNSSAWPRVHHKFVVFCKIERRNRTTELSAESEIDLVLPYATWTGSYNFSLNATKSLENAVFIRRKDITQSFVNEWAQIVAISEPLDWDHEWIEPEFRIGT